MSKVWLFAMLGICVLALVYVVYNYVNIKKMKEGNERMVKMSAIIREGAGVFLKKEFTTIGIVALTIAVLFSLFIETYSGLTYILGALMSSVVCVLGMKSATYANVRTANTAKESLSIGKTVKVALGGGSISGLSVQVLGLLGILLIVIISGLGPQTELATLSGAGIQSYQGCGIVFIDALLTNSSVMRITSYSLGCSTVAMFNRVAGGNFTKAADISADILGKIRNDLPEDDSRVPNVIADFIGDNVNDIAGNCSDLLESFVATMSASIVVAIGLIAKMTGTIFISSYIFPLVVAGGGLLGCILGLAYAQIKKMGDDPSKELNLATYISAGISILTCGVAAYLAFGNVGAEALKTIMEFKAGWASPWICAVLGILSGVAIGTITEYYTSDKYKPTKQIAEYSTEGEAFVVTKGDAVGSRSCLYPISIIAISLLVSGILGGYYGIAIASLGMLSFVGTTVSIDAFGPIADNAGGLAESCHLAPEVRVITDKLDSVGNTTAAIGKGFAIGSAAFATVSLIVAFIGNYASAGITAPAFSGLSLITVVAGLIIGGALIEFFSAILTDNTIRSAKELAVVGDRQLSDPAILAGDKDPDYNELVHIATTSALKRMLFPSIIALAVPLIGGAIFGLNFVLGILLGATVVAIPRAIFMGNSGGAFDNAKKYIEQGK
ncbi:MAG: sodium/proton-translocating pyrophosphatase, partial [Clostridia bacterium]|nr:sodium/proton-translocating pyrophosphatase [Clostridia bacterium]